MAEARKIKNEADALACLAAARASGAGTAQWARAHGVDGRSLNAWRVNMERRGDGPEGFVEVVPGAVPGGRYVLEVDGARLEFDDGCSSHTLRRVLDVLRAC